MHMRYVKAVTSLTLPIISFCSGLNFSICTMGCIASLTLRVLSWVSGWF